MTNPDLLQAATTALAFFGESLDEPRFDEATPVHDWRTYVPDAVRAAWPTLCPTARAAVVLTANTAAAREEWD